VRNTWVSPPLFRDLLRACQEVSRWEGSLTEEIEGRLRLWPETGGWSLPERILLAEVCWMDSPAGQPPPVAPTGALNKGTVGRYLDYWLSLADERFRLPGGVEGSQALGKIEVFVDWDGSFEPYTLRLPEENRLRNPSVRVLGVRGAAPRP